MPANSRRDLIRGLKGQHVLWVETVWNLLSLRQHWFHADQELVITHVV